MRPIGFLRIKNKVNYTTLWLFQNGWQYGANESSGQEKSAGSTTNLEMPTGIFKREDVCRLRLCNVLWV
jgi:hypothetical protein